jgi:endoglucanase
VAAVETAQAAASETKPAAEPEESEHRDWKQGLILFLKKNQQALIIAGLVLLLLLIFGIGIASGINSGGTAVSTNELTTTEAVESLAASDNEQEAVASVKDGSSLAEQEGATSIEATQKEDEETSKSTKKASEETSERDTKQDEEQTTKASEKDSAAETTAQETTKASATEAQKETTKAQPAQTQAATTAAAVTPVKAESGTPYGNHGKLTVSGTNILDQNGNIYQLKGVSTHGIGWFPDYVNAAAFQTMRDEWGINVVRIAMYTAEYNGYCAGGDQTWLKNLVDTGVQAATQLGLYVIIDWHILSDGNPNTNKASSLAFFKEVTAKYASYGNVLYEICNEPNGGVGWSEIKSYAEEVIPVIRANAKDAIIIVGTPTWSQDVDQAAANPITGQINIMYTLHFYAATHKDDLRNKMTAAIAKGLPIFVTEYGICDASGSGGIDEASANTWMALLDQYHVSSCIWNLSNKSETSALISSGCSKTSGWTTSDLSASGKWFVNMMKGSLSGLGTTQTAQTGNQTSQTQAAATQAQTQAPTQAQTEYVAPTTQAPKQASGSNCSVQANNTNSWGDSTQGYHMQLDVAVKNTGSSAISGWKVVLTFSGSVEVESSWNGTVTVSGKTITITSDADWNATIQAGGSVNPGLIVKSSSEVQLTGCAIQ